MHSTFLPTRLRLLLPALLVLLLAAPMATAPGQTLLPGEFGNIELDRELIEADRLPTVSELRAAVSKPQIEFVLMLRLHASKNNHHLPVWSPNGQSLAFQRSRIGVDSSQIMLYQSLADEQPRLLSQEQGTYDYMFRWGLNNPRSFVFARIDQAQQSTMLLYSPDGTQLTPLTTTGGEYAYPALYERTDGIHWLAFEEGGQLTHRAWQGEQQSQRVLARGSSPRWSHDGRRLLYAKEVSQRGDLASYQVAVRNLADSQELVIDSPAGAVVRSPSWSPQQTAAAYFVRQAGEGSPWQIQVSRLIRGAGPSTIVNDCRVNASFKSEGPSWEPSGKRIWCFSNRHREQEYYPLVAAELNGGTTLIDYPRQCTTPGDLAVNPASEIPELALVGHRGLTQDLFIMFLNHY